MSRYKSNRNGEYESAVFPKNTYGYLAEKYCVLLENTLKCFPDDVQTRQMFCHGAIERYCKQLLRIREIPTTDRLYLTHDVEMLWERVGPELYERSHKLILVTMSRGYTRQTYPVPEQEDDCTLSDTEFDIAMDLLEEIRTVAEKEYSNHRQVRGQLDLMFPDKYGGSGFTRMKLE